MQTTTFRLRCLGPAMLLGSDDARVSFETRKHLVLLYYLARHPGRPVSRDELTDLFWHGDEEKKARHSLSHAVSLINKSMRAEAIAVVSAGRLMMPEGMVDLDVRDFERLVAEGQFIQARELWNGRLFEGYWIPRAPKLEEWLAVERGRLERVFRRVLHELIEDHRAAGDHEMMRQEAEALLDLDELDEKAMLGYLESLTLLGDRTLALRRFAEFEKRIGEELQVAPRAELRAWAKRQRRTDDRPVDRTGTAEQSALPAAQPVFGRDDQYRFLWEAWQRASESNGGLLIIEGEPGIGKTALAVKLLHQVHVAGGSVCYAKCHRTDQAVPYAPIASLVRQLSRLPGFVSVDGLWISELSRLVPELRRRFPDILPPMVVDETARHRLTDATCQVADAVAFEQPLMIIVDDVQNADEASLAALHFLARQTATKPILIICTRRCGPWISRAEQTFMESVHSSGSVSFLDLQGMTNEHLAEILTRVLARHRTTLNDFEIAKIISSSNGNPLRAIEAALYAGPRAETNSSSVEPERGDAFDRTAMHRLLQMSKAAQVIAQHLVVAGRPLSDYELAELCGLPPVDRASGCSELEDAGFARYFGSCIGFAHERYAVAAEASMRTDLKPALHLIHAKWLARSIEANPPATYQVAIHYYAAGKTNAAASHAQAAGAFAQSMGAVREKAEALALAIRAGDESETVLIELAEAYLDLNSLDQLRTVCAAQKNTLSDNAAACLKYLSIAGELAAGRLSFVVAQDALEALLGDGERFRLQYDAALLLMQVADKTGDYRRAKAVGKLLWRTKKKTEAATTFAHFAAGYCFGKYYWPSRAVEHFAAAAQFAEANGRWALAQQSRDAQAIALKATGRFTESIAVLENTLAMSRKTLNRHAELRSLQNRAVSEIALGDFAQSLRTLKQAESISDAWPFAAYTPFNTGVTHYICGDYDQARHYLYRALRMAEDNSNRLLIADCWAFLALCEQRAGNLNEMSRLYGVFSKCEVESIGSRVGFAAPAIAAWHLAVSGNPSEGVDMLDKLAKQLRRRDLAMWLAALHELLRLQEWIDGRVRADLRSELLKIAAGVEGNWMTRAMSVG